MSKSNQQLLGEFFSAHPNAFSASQQAQLYYAARKPEGVPVAVVTRALLSTSGSLIYADDISGGIVNGEIITDNWNIKQDGSVAFAGEDFAIKPDGTIKSLVIPGRDQDGIDALEPGSLYVNVGDDVVRIKQA